MKKLVAFLMAFALCVMCFGTYGVAMLDCTDDCMEHDHSHDLVVHAAGEEDEDEFLKEYLYLNTRNTTYSYSELTKTLRVTIAIDSESTEKGAYGHFQIQIPYNQALGAPTIIYANVFGASASAADIDVPQTMTGSTYSTITYDVYSEGENDRFTQTINLVFECPVNTQNAAAFSWYRTVNMYIDGDVRTVSGQVVEFEGRASYTAYLCNHASTAYQTTKEATCKTSGEKQLVCQSCGYVLRTEMVLPTDHDLDYSKAFNTNLYPEIKPTCSKVGSGCYKCKDCGTLINGSVPKLDHQFGDRYIKNGVYYIKCTVCNTEQIATNQCPHDLDAYNLLIILESSTCTVKGSARYQCPTCKQVEERELELADHKLGTPTITKNATCLVNGAQTRTCSVCKQMIAESIPATGHTFGAWQTTVQATCISVGQQTRTCTACGYAESQSIQGSGHNYSQWVEFESPTCTATGTSVRTCMLCGDRQSEVIAMSAHQYGAYTTTTPATCIAAGEETRYCARCNVADKKVVNPIADNHKFGEWVTVSEKTCTTNGEKTRTCEYCSKVENDVVACVGHSFGDSVIDGKTTTKTCAVCGYKEAVTSLKDGTTEKTLTALSSGSLVLSGMEANKSYTFEIGVPSMEKEAYYREYYPGTFHKAYTFKVLSDGKEVNLNANMDLVIRTGIEDYEISLSVLRNGSFWPVSDFERDGDAVIISGDALVGAEVVFVERGAEIKPGLVIPIVVTVGTLIVAGAAIYFFVVKSNKKKTF